MAERVRQSGRPLTLEPMGAYERRIVHLALRGDPTVYTESSGEGDNRKVVIYPAKST
jgi:spoIIIJ-associated protein